MKQQPCIQVCRLGRLPYQVAWKLQQQLAELRKQDLIHDTLLLLEHDHVITFGRNVGSGSLLLDEASLKEQGVALIESDRGGDATYHGPGQLIAYPIIDLKVDMRDIRRYVWTLEESMIRVMARYGLSGDRVDGAPGAWLKSTSKQAFDCKMGAVGVRLSRWVTHHGLGFNVNTDLSYFKMIIPCGLVDKGVTSLKQELGTELDMNKVQDQFIDEFCRLFNRQVLQITFNELTQLIHEPTSQPKESL